MSTLIKFPFQKKEGKYFAPIVSEHTTYKVDAGAVVADSTKIVNGLKGAYANIKLTLPVANASIKKELYALNAETIFSSQ
jgi:hypothetical protein